MPRFSSGNNLSHGFVVLSWYIVNTTYVQQTNLLFCDTIAWYFKYHLALWRWDQCLHLVSFLSGTWGCVVLEEVVVTRQPEQHQRSLPGDWWFSGEMDQERCSLVKRCSWLPSVKQDTAVWEQLGCAPSLRAFKHSVPGQASCSEGGFLLKQWLLCAHCVFLLVSLFFAQGSTGGLEEKAVPMGRSSGRSWRLASLQ